MSSQPVPLSASDVERVVVAPWRVVGDVIEADYRSQNMVAGGEFVARVIDAAEAANHHPDIDLRYATVHFTLSTHSVGALTQLDVDLAKDISRIAAELGISEG